MIDDSPNPQPTYLSDEDANFLASLLLGTATTPSAPAVVDLTVDGDLIVDLTEGREPSDSGRNDPTISFDKEEGLSALLTGPSGARVADLVDVQSVINAKVSPDVVARSVFGRPEPGGTRHGVRQESVAAHGSSDGWFRPVAEVPTPIVSEAALFDKAPHRGSVVVRLDTAAAGDNDEAVVFGSAVLPNERRRKYLLAALFLGAVAVGGGITAVLLDRQDSQNDPAAPPTTVAVATSAAPTTAAPITEAPTTLAPTTTPPTTVAPTTAAPTTTIAPTTTTAAPTTAAPTTRAAPRTTARPRTTAPPVTTAPPTTVRPTITFAPPTWDDPLD